MNDTASVTVTAETADPPKSALDRFFGLSQRATSLPQEMIAGATTFASMAYIIAVNPAIMSNAGMDRGDLVMATALAAIFGSIMMWLCANPRAAICLIESGGIILTSCVVRALAARELHTTYTHSGRSKQKSRSK